MTPRAVDFEEWMQRRRAMLPQQIAILTRETDPADRPAPGDRPSPSHRPRTDDEWAAITEGVQALRAERVHRGGWTWLEPRRLVIADPPTPEDPDRRPG